MTAKLVHLLSNEYFKLYSLSRSSLLPGFLPPGTLLNGKRVSISSSEYILHISKFLILNWPRPSWSC